MLGDLGVDPLAAVGSPIRLLQPATSLWASLWDYRAGRGARSGLDTTFIVSDITPTKAAASQVMVGPAGLGRARMSQGVTLTAVCRILTSSASRARY